MAYYLCEYNQLTGGQIQKKKVFLIAHSMGGLVARMAILAEPNIKNVIEGIVALGTPNDGALVGSNLVKYFVTHGERLAGLMGIDAAKTLSAKELTKTDYGTNRPIIDYLNAAWTSKKDLPPVLTISGGKQKLEFAENNIWNQYINQKIQQWMRGHENDGLVTEDSVATLVKTDNYSHAGRNEHFNEYPKFRQINHTYLTENAQVALKIIKWIEGLVVSLD